MFNSPSLDNKALNMSLTDFDEYVNITLSYGSFSDIKAECDWMSGNWITELNNNNITIRTY